MARLPETLRHHKNRLLLLPVAILAACNADPAPEVELTVTGHEIVTTSNGVRHANAQISEIDLIETQKKPDGIFLTIDWDSTVPQSCFIFDDGTTIRQVSTEYAGGSEGLEEYNLVFEVTPANGAIYTVTVDKVSVWNTELEWKMCDNSGHPLLALVPPNFGARDISND